MSKSISTRHIQVQEHDFEVNFTIALILRILVCIVDRPQWMNLVYFGKTKLEDATWAHVNKW